MSEKTLNKASVESDTSIQPIVDVDHVDMIFNMANQQLNSLKEYAVAALRRELFFKEFKALDDINIKIYPGDVYGIVGTNGSGKSTLLKIVAGVLEPSHGNCTINGTIAPLIELGAGFDQDLTARENVYLNGALLGYSKKFIDEHMEEIIDFAEIRDFMDIPIKNFSSGMVARIAFAIATATIPDILVVDEALSVGDFLFQRKCEDRIAELVDKHHTTLLFVSHSVEQVERVCDKAVWIEKGHLVMQGEVKDVCEEYRNYQGAALQAKDIIPASLSMSGVYGDLQHNSANKCTFSLSRLETSENGFIATKDDPWIDITFESPQNYVKLTFDYETALHPTTLYYQTELVPNYTPERIVTLELQETNNYERVIIFDQAITTLRIDITETQGETNIKSISINTYSDLHDLKTLLPENANKKEVKNLFEPASPSKKIEEAILKLQ